MATSKFSMIALAIGLAIALASGASAATGKEYKFRGAPDGSYPETGLVADGAGNFFGTTAFGGLLNCPYRSACGTVFEASIDQNGQGSEKVIYQFKGDPDGWYPLAGLTLDAAGNLYGTTYYGGTEDYGTVFELSPNQDGSWSENIIYSFQGGMDGQEPESGLVFDSAGGLYGTTSYGGMCYGIICGGTVYELVPGQGGGWKKSTAFVFSITQNQGQSSQPGPLVFDGSGNLYGTTFWGGSSGEGSVFQLTPNQDGSWTENVLYSFTDGLDGGNPEGGVTFDVNGNLYGEATVGGSLACPMYGCGLIFELTPESGTWKYSVAYKFSGLDGKKGQTPIGGLTLDSAGNFYGTTEEGGNAACFGYGGCGEIFKLAPDGSGWTLSTIATFDGAHGASPQGGVIIDGAGNLYGTASAGGDLNCNAPVGCGVVFEVTP